MATARSQAAATESGALGRVVLSGPISPVPLDYKQPALAGAPDRDPENTPRERGTCWGTGARRGGTLAGRWEREGERQERWIVVGEMRCLNISATQYINPLFRVISSNLFSRTAPLPTEPNPQHGTSPPRCQGTPHASVVPTVLRIRETGFSLFVLDGAGCMYGAWETWL